MATIVSIFFSSRLYAQQIAADSTAADEEQIDTVFVKKDPYIIRKTVSYNGEKKDTDKNNSVEFFINGNSYSNYYAICPECARFLAQVKASGRPVLSGGGGIGYAYTKKRFYITGNINYSSFREKFNFTDSLNTSYHSINTVNYFGANLGIGLRFIQKRKIEMIFLPEIGWRKLLSAKGKSFLSETDLSVVDLSSLKRYTNSGYTILVGIKINYQLSKNIKLFVEPYYQGDLTSITKSDQPFLAQKIVFGSRVGMLYPF